MTGLWKADFLSSVVALTTALVIVLKAEVSEAGTESKDVATTTWAPATATFYGGSDAAGTAGGYCGYENPFTRGYGVSTAAISNSLLNDGLNCGACFEVMCKYYDSDYTKKWCYNGKTTIVTATNLSPPGLNGEHHFDLAQPMFENIANMIGGRLPIQYRRVPCSKQGGVRFTIMGNPYFNLVLAFNVAGGGNVHAMAMKGSQTGWYTMNRNWGQNWQASCKLTGQALSFRVTLGSGSTLVLSNVADSNWQHGQTYEADMNF